MRRFALDASRPRGFTLSRLDADKEMHNLVAARKWPPRRRDPASAIADEGHVLGKELREPRGIPGGEGHREPFCDLPGSVGRAGAVLHGTL